MVLLKRKTRRKFLIITCTVFMVSLEYTFGAEIALWRYMALFSDNFFFIIFICCAFLAMYYICWLFPLLHNNGNGCSVQYNQQPVQNFIEAAFGVHWRTNGGITDVWMWFVFILSLKEIQIPFLSSMIICLVLCAFGNDNKGDMFNLRAHCTQKNRLFKVCLYKLRI